MLSKMVQNGRVHVRQPYFNNCFSVGAYEAHESLRSCQQHGEGHLTLSGHNFTEK